jgi:O-antigen/teichoic acid export membrane protein
MLPHATVGFQKSKEEGLQRVNRNLSVSVLALALSGLFMFLVSPWIVTELFGPEYSASIGLFNVLLIVPFLTGISATLSNQILLNIGKDNWVLWITTLGAFLGDEWLCHSNNFDRISNPNFILVFLSKGGLQCELQLV